MDLLSDPKWGLARYAPGEGDVVDRLLTRGLRRGLPPAEAAARLLHAVDAAFHEIYLVTASLALLAFGRALSLPQRAAPHRPFIRLVVRAQSGRPASTRTSAGDRPFARSSRRVVA
jgi:hypothetical protein